MGSTADANIRDEGSDHDFWIVTAPELSLIILTLTFGSRTPITFEQGLFRNGGLVPLL